MLNAIERGPHPVLIVQGPPFCIQIFQAQAAGCISPQLDVFHDTGSTCFYSEFGIAGDGG